MVFSGGVPWNPPLCTNGSAGYLMQLSVKTYQCSFFIHVAYSISCEDFIHIHCIIIIIYCFLKQCLKNSIHVYV